MLQTIFHHCMCLRDHLEEVIILGYDQLIYNRSSTSRVYTLRICAVSPVENGTDGTPMQVDDGAVTTVAVLEDRKDGNYSISSWTKEDGQQLKRHLEIEFEYVRITMIFTGMMW